MFVFVNQQLHHFHLIKSVSESVKIIFAAMEEGNGPCHCMLLFQGYIFGSLIISCTSVQGWGSTSLALFLVIRTECVCVCVCLGICVITSIDKKRLSRTSTIQSE